MRVFTQGEFDALPVVDGFRQCPPGDYSAVREFDDWCSFGVDNRFGERCIFGAGCSFGAGSCFGSNCSFGAGSCFGSNCSFGERCTFSAESRFGSHCSFGHLCRFGVRCEFGRVCGFGEICCFGSECRFGEVCSFGDCCSFDKGGFFNGKRALPGYPLLALSGAGSANRTVYAFNVEGGPWIEAGCFSGDLDDFRAKVRADGAALKCLQYLGFANIVAATWCPEKVEP
jgi:hypothetical protein